jgi:hypothetical protein
MRLLLLLLQPAFGFLTEIDPPKEGNRDVVVVVRVVVVVERGW